MYNESLLKDQIQNKLGLKLLKMQTLIHLLKLKDQIQNKLGLKHDKAAEMLKKADLKDQIQNKLGLKLSVLLL